MATETTPMPIWAEEMKRRYLRGEAVVFVLHGNVHDLVFYQNKSMPLEDFLTTAMLGPSKDTVCLFNVASGVRFQKSKVKSSGFDDLLLERSREKVFPIFERILLTETKFALVLQYAETLCPAADMAMSSDVDRATLVSLHRWASMPQLDHNDNVVILLVENLSELNPRLLNHARISTVQIPLPSESERTAFIAKVAPSLDEGTQHRLVNLTAGLKLTHMGAILAPEDTADDVNQRKNWIASLLKLDAASPRVVGLANITKGMGLDEIRNLVAPGQTPAHPNSSGEMERLVSAQKRELIERECAGLLEFIVPKHGFEAVGGMEEVKRELNRVAQAVREGASSRVPMGFLFVGPMGTGKTFVAEAFAKESGLTAVKFGSFRSKWVGATEANLDRILDVLQGMGQVLVILDEVDRALAGQDGSSDGGTESRVIAKLKEFMSDGKNRGKILFVLMTNRPDLLDTDIKRTGRLDRKIPFFYPQTATEVLPVMTALIRRYKLNVSFDLSVQPSLLEPLAGYSNADIEGVLLLAASLADSAGHAENIQQADFVQASADYLASRDVNMIQYMELLAVYEASNRSMLPEKYRVLTADELSEKLQLARAHVGSRR